MTLSVSPNTCRDGVVMGLRYKLSCCFWRLLNPATSITKSNWYGPSKNKTTTDIVKSAITPRYLNKSHFIFIFFCKYTYKHNMSLRCMYKPQNFKNFRFLVLQYLLWTASIWSTFNLIVTVQIFSQAYLALVLWGHRSVIPWSLPDWMLEYHQRGPVKHDINWGIRTNKIVVACIL